MCLDVLEGQIFSRDASRRGGLRAMQARDDGQTSAPTAPFRVLLYRCPNTLLSLRPKGITLLMSLKPSQQDPTSKCYYRFTRRLAS